MATRCDGVETKPSNAIKWCPRCQKNTCTRYAETTLMGCNSANYWCEICGLWLSSNIIKRWGQKESGYMPEIPVDELPSDVMPFGKHKGIPLDEVPDSYLDWLAGQDWVKDRWPVVWKYIMDNLEDIHKGIPDDD